MTEKWQKSGAVS